MRTILILVISFCFTTAALAQISIVRNGKATGRIVVNQSHTTDLKAANILNSFIKKITGVTLPVVSVNTKIERGDLILESQSALKESGIEEDGFRFTSNDSTFVITGTCFVSFNRRFRYCQRYFMSDSLSSSTSIDSWRCNYSDASFHKTSC